MLQFESTLAAIHHCYATISPNMPEGVHVLPLCLFINQINFSSSGFFHLLILTETTGEKDFRRITIFSVTSQGTVDDTRQVSSSHESMANQKHKRAILHKL